jgi:hypothetical protein
MATVYLGNTLAGDITECWNCDRVMIPPVEFGPKESVTHAAGICVHCIEHVIEAQMGSDHIHYQWRTYQGAKLFIANGGKYTRKADGYWYHDTDGTYIRFEDTQPVE